MAEAAHLAAQLGPFLPRGSRIVSSPRRRAVETAEVIARFATDTRIELDERWAETDFGVAEGLTFEELTRLAPEIATRLVAGQVDVDWPGGESSAELITRVEAAWRDAATRAPRTLIVTHGGPMRVAIALATRVPSTAVAIPGPGGIWRPQDQAATEH